jgi:transposase
MWRCTRLRPLQIEPIPPDTARVARAAFPTGNRYLRLADELDTLCSDATLLALFPTPGQRALPPWRLALVKLRQCAEGRSARQAAEAVRRCIAWTYVLRLTAAGVNVLRLGEWFLASARAKTRVTPFARLMANGTAA